MPGLVSAIENVKVKETLVPISFAVYLPKHLKVSGFQQQPFLLLTILWVSNLIWAQLGGSSDFGWAHVRVCGQLLRRLWAGWSKRASARTVYLCSMCLLILRQASRSLLTCQPTRQGSRRAEWKLARAVEAWTWNLHCLTSTIFCSPKQVDECILAYFSAAGRQFEPRALLRA